MQMKPIIYILGNYKPGDSDGLAEFNSQNVLLLRDIFEFHFVQFDPQNSTDVYKQEVRDSFAIHIFGTKNLTFRLSLLFSEWLQRREGENCIFHISHIYNITNYLVVRKLVRARVPYLITPHDSYVYSPSFTSQKPMLKRVYRALFVQVFDKYILDHASVIHGLTPQCSAALGFITKSPVTIVNNQVNDMKLEFNSTEIQPQICFIGRFDIYRKGIDLALTAYQLFKEINTDGDHVNFTLVGPADSEATSSCSSLCNKLGLTVGEDVIFTGKITVNERNTILIQSKVYLHLARTEGFGLSIAQALSCSKPVIISKQIPIGEKVIAHKAGYVVDNPQEAALALKKIFALSTSEYNQLASNARKCYEKEFHPNIVKPQLIDLYLRTFGTEFNLNKAK
jgi:glycosyltransferase involved in cell wall biosynthesis